jgi:hypothetical protein
METFLLVSVILSSFCFLIAIYRLNAGLVSIPTDTGLSIQTGNLLLRLNTFGKWLTLFGGVATFPLVIGLIFFSDNSVKWIVNLGLAGCVAMIAATILLVSAFLGTCISRRIQVKRMLLDLVRLTTTKIRSFIRQRSLWIGAVGSLLILLVLFVPFFAQLVGGVVYFLGLVLIVRLGLADIPNGEDTDNGGGVMALTRSFNYATGKWDDGCQHGGMY